MEKRVTKRIVWNSEKGTVKYGAYIGKIRHTYRYDGDQLAMVRFDGNKRVSRVPFIELSLVDEDCKESE